MAIALRLSILGCLAGAAWGQLETPAEEAPAEHPKAQGAYEAGVGHFEAGRYADAIREFNKAYRADPNPVLVFNMARAFEELKEYASAIEFYRRYLEMSPDAEDRAAVEDALRTLELLQKQSQPALVALAVTSEPDGARVLIDGREVGTTPARLELPAGQHFVAVEKDGFTRASAEVELTADTPAKQHLALVPLAAAPAAAAEASSGTAGWVLVGVGGALLAGAAVTGALALQQQGTVDDLVADRGTAQGELDDSQSSGKALAYTTDGLLLGGAAAAITGGVLLLTE